MWFQSKLLDAARDSLGKGATDYRLCKVMGISTAYMSQLRKGDAIVSQKMAVRLAVLAKAPAEEVLPVIEMQRAARDYQDDGTMLGTWQRIAKAMSAKTPRKGRKVAAAAVLSVAALSGLAAPGPSQAATGAAAARFDGYIHYANSHH